VADPPPPRETFKQPRQLLRKCTFCFVHFTLSVHNCPRVYTAMTTVGYTSSRLAPTVARWNRSGTSSSACSSSCASSSSPRALRRGGDAGSSLSIGFAKSKQAVRRRGDVVSVRARVGTAFNKKNGNKGDDEDDEDDAARTSRRALLAGKVLFTVGGRAWNSPRHTSISDLKPYYTLRTSPYTPRPEPQTKP